MLLNRFGLGLCSVTLAHDPIGQVVAWAQRCGVEGIEWSARDHVAPGDLTAAAEARRRCSDAGIKVASYASYHQAGIDDTSAIPALIDAALALGARLVRVWAGRRGLPIAHPEQAGLAAAVDGLLALGEQFSPHGIELSLEHHRLTLTDGAAETLALIDRCGAQGLGVLTHWQPRPGLTVEQAEAELTLLGAHLSHLHVFEWDATLRRFPLQQGEGRWARQIAAANRAQPDWAGPAFACLEFVEGDSQAQLLRDAMVLWRVLEACEAHRQPDR